MAEPNEFKLRVELSDRQAVIDHYQPAAGQEDTVCNEYLSHYLQQIELNLGMELCPLVTRQANLIVGTYDKDVAPTAEDVKRRFLALKIPGITITEA